MSVMSGGVFRIQKRSMLARMSEADLVQRNGFGAALCWLMKLLMSALSEATLR